MRGLSLVLLALLASCKVGTVENNDPESGAEDQATSARGSDSGETGQRSDVAEKDRSGDGAGNRDDDDKGKAPEPPSDGYRFVGRWATEQRNCGRLAWRFTASSLETPAGSVCRFSKVTEVPGGYDIAAHCTAEGTSRNETLRLRFAESAGALLFESELIADAGLVRCG